MKKYLKEVIIGTLALIVFFIIAFLVFGVVSKGFDTAVHDFVISFSSDFTTGFFKFITFFGGIIFTIVLAVCSIMLLINREKSTCKQFVKNEKVNDFINLIAPWLIFVISILLVTILFLVFKEIFARERPTPWFLIEEDGWSFPSGHTATSVAMYGVLCLIINRSINKKWLKIFNISFVLVLAFLIGLSRIYLGVHYATDVLAGACLGVFVICIASILLKLGDIKVNLRKATK